MDNNRYTSPTSSLHPLALVLAVLSALVLTLNGLRLLHLLPDAEPLRLLAPAGATLGFLALATVLALVVRTYPGAGVATVVTGLLAVLMTAMLAGIELITHYVLSVLPGAQRQEVLAGPLMAVLVVASFGFILAMWAFGGLLVARRQVAWPPVAVLAVGAALVGLRVALPEAAPAVGVILTGIGIVGLVSSVGRRSSQELATAR